MSQEKDKEVLNLSQANSASKMWVRSVDTETHYNSMTFLFSEELLLNEKRIPN